MCLQSSHRSWAPYIIIFRWYCELCHAESSDTFTVGTNTPDSTLGLVTLWKSAWPATSWNSHDLFSTLPTWFTNKMKSDLSHLYPYLRHSTPAWSAFQRLFFAKWRLPLLLDASQTTSRAGRSLAHRESARQRSLRQRWDLEKRKFLFFHIFSMRHNEDPSG